MASLKEDNINFDKLESGVHKAIDAENLYWLQNDAKFRAVKQKGSYDEFKEIVAAAHLKPLAKDDKIQLEEKIVSPWNTSVRNSNSTASVVNDTIAHGAAEWTVPLTSHAFILQWRKQKTTQAKAEYLNQMLEYNEGSSHIVTIFKNEIPFGLLGEFICTISSQLKTFDVAVIEKFLTALPQTGRFSLSLTFLSGTEKGCLNSTFDYVDKCGIDSILLRQQYQ